MVENRLETDRLEKKYGILHAKILRHTKYIREVFLVDSRGVKQEYAITFLNSKVQGISQISRKIKNGTLIGKTFRNHGYEIIKKDEDYFMIDLPDRLKEAFVTQKKTAKAKMYKFCFKKVKQPLQTYGTILEIYNPN